MSEPFYCRPCGEILTETQSICPFCDSDADLLGDVLLAKFEARARAFNERVQRILDAEERRA